MIKQGFLIYITALVFIALSSCNSPDSNSQSSDADTTFNIDPKAYELPKEEKIELATQILNEYKNEQLQLFKDEVIPIILTTVSERFADDFEKILTEYNGFGGFKMIDTYDGFYEAWQKFFAWVHYEFMVNENLEAFYQVNEDFYTDICSQFGINDIKLQYPPRCFTHFDIPRHDVEQFVKEEQGKALVTLGDFAIDGLLITAEILTAGAATPIVVVVAFANGAKTGYDIVKFTDELFFDESVDNNEKLMIAITEGIMVQLGTYLEKEYTDYFEKQTQSIIYQLEADLK